MTPREFQIYLEAKHELDKNRVNELLFTAWHVEAFARQKRLPKLKSIIKNQGIKKKKKKQSEDDFYRNLLNINSMLGGKTVES